MFGYFLFYEFWFVKFVVWGLLLLVICVIEFDSCDWVFMIDYFLIRI